MFKSRIIVATAVAGLILGGCASTTSAPVDREVAGAGLGALTGALLGYGLGKGHSDKEAAIVIGALLGGVAGAKIGAQLSEADRIIAGRNLTETLERQPIGSSNEWRNPDSGHHGYSVPTRTYQQSDGSPCREFTTVVYVGGQQQEAYGTACRQADGSWKIQS